MSDSVKNNSTEPLAFLQGKVVRGFGRGGKQLGFPTANLDEQCVKRHNDLETGVYWGFCRVNSQTVEHMVMSVGWNPQFENKEKSIEVHVLKKYPEDFYGETLRVLVLGYIREMTKFTNLQGLIDAINGDIAFAKNALLKPTSQQWLAYEALCKPLSAPETS
mmetsp:Transcript_5368/g.5851  ORF Transcript_5368/g.5851 Transcript_5368/m.5851 type:complete len:162 (-) Transcript_5368:304-789(-)